MENVKKDQKESDKIWVCSCGNILHDDVIICPHCGKMLEEPRHVFRS